MVRELGFTRDHKNKSESMSLTCFNSAALENNCSITMGSLIETVPFFFFFLFFYDMAPRWIPISHGHSEKSLNSFVVSMG